MANNFDDPMASNPPAAAQSLAEAEWRPEVPAHTGSPMSNPKQKWGDKKLKTQFVPPTAICAMARGLGEGAAKYGPYNWRDQPVEALTYYGGAMRHLLAWLDGEDIDPDSEIGKTHLEGAISSLAILIDAVESGCVIDNRPNAGGAPRMLLTGARNESLDPNLDSA